MCICGHVCAREKHVRVGGQRCSFSASIFMWVWILTSDHQACSTSAFTWWAISCPKCLKQCKKNSLKQCKKTVTSWKSCLWRTKLARGCPGRVQGIQLTLSRQMGKGVSKLTHLPSCFFWPLSQGPRVTRSVFTLTPLVTLFYSTLRLTCLWQKHLVTSICNVPYTILTVYRGVSVSW